MFRKYKMTWAVALSGALVLGGLAGSAFAAHPTVVLADANGVDIGPTNGNTTAVFSFDKTCSGCHTDLGTGSYGPEAPYVDIEKHSYHTQLGANEFKGWNNWNPDSPDGFKSGPAPKGKNWTQAPGHVGKW